MSTSNITFITIQNKSVLVHVCFFLFIVCSYICVSKCLLQKNNHKTKHKNNTNCGSAFEPGASGLPYYCTSICVRFGCTRLASCIDSTQQKRKKPKRISRLPWGSGLRRCQSLPTNLSWDSWHRRFTLLPWWPPLQTWACLYVSLCSSYVRLVAGTSSQVPRNGRGRRLLELTNGC